MLSLYSLGLIVPICSFFLQIWPRLRKRYFGVDTWKWLVFAQYVRVHKRLPKRSTSRYIINSVYGYPPVIILILSLFPKFLLEKYQFVFSPTFDFFHNFFIYVIAVVLTRDVTTGIFAQIIAALVPLIVIESSNLNTRILSVLIFSISFVSLIMFITSGSFYWLIVAAFFLFILFFTHRFAIQAYIVSILGLAIVEKNVMYILFFIGVYALVVLIGRKLYRAMFREHIGSIRYWSDKIDFRFAHQIRGLSNRDEQKKDFIWRAYNLSVRSPFMYMLGSNPWIGFLLVIFIASITHVFPVLTIHTSILIKLEVWVASLLLWAFLVLSVKKLRIFGEGHRYIEYTVFPIAIIGGLYATSFWYTNGFIFVLVFIPLVVLFLGIIIQLQIKTIIRDRSRTLGTALWSIIKYLNRYGGKGVRLATFPIHIADSMLYFTKSTVLYSDTYLGLARMPDVYPVMRKPVGKTLKKYKINHVLFDREYVTSDELGLSNNKILMDVNDYVLVKL